MVNKSHFYVTKLISTTHFNYTNSLIHGCTNVKRQSCRTRLPWGGTERLLTPSSGWSSIWITLALCWVQNLLQASFSLSFCFNSHIPGGPGLADARMSPFWILLELRMMEVVVTSGAVRRAKLQSNVTTNKPTPSFLQAGCPSCRPTNSIKGNSSWPVSRTKYFPQVSLTVCSAS